MFPEGTRELEVNSESFSAGEKAEFVNNYSKGNTRPAGNKRKNPNITPHLG